MFYIEEVIFRLNNSTNKMLTNPVIFVTINWFIECSKRKIDLLSGGNWKEKSETAWVVIKLLRLSRVGTGHLHTLPTLCRRT